jgi:hypothetical protein
MAIVPALTATATDIMATGVVLSRTRIVCGSAADGGGKQWIGQTAGAMSAAAVAVDSKTRDSSIPQAVKKKWEFVRHSIVHTDVDETIARLGWHLPIDRLVCSGWGWLSAPQSKR